MKLTYCRSTQQIILGALLLWGCGKPKTVLKTPLDMGKPIVLHDGGSDTNAHPIDAGSDEAIGGDDMEVVQGDDMEIVQGQDMNVVHRDMAIRDSAMTHDLPPPPSVDGGACIVVNSWPGLRPFGRFDSVVTRVASADTASGASTQLLIEDWQAMGETYPKMANFSGSDTYANCEVCAIVAACDSSSVCIYQYLAQAGAATVTRADRHEKTGRMTATATNLKLIEWDFSRAVDAPVPGGKCYEIASASFDVTWNRCAPVINEVQTAGASAGDEFVEIHNPCGGSVDLTGWKLVYRSASNSSGSDSTLLSLTQSIAAGGYLLLGGVSFSGTADAQFGRGVGLAAGGGAVGLRSPAGDLVDSVSYGTLTAPNDLTEGAPASAPPASQSIARKPNGTDTDHNNSDFVIAATPTPKAAN